MGRDPCCSLPVHQTRCFNPRARMGRDRTHEQHRGRTHVSIHAPAWGATLSAGHLLLGLRVSIHAPAWGATPLCVIDFSYKKRFNPRARMGRDPIAATIASESAKFQSTRPHGARLCSDEGIRRKKTFQSTRPHGARREIVELSK